METLKSHFKNTHWHYHKYLCCSRICVRILVCHLMPLYTNESKVCYMLKEHHHSAWGKITASETTSSTEQLHPPFLVPPSFCFTLISIYFTSVFKLYDHTYFLLPSFYHQSFHLLFIILFVWVDCVFLPVPLFLHPFLIFFLSCSLPSLPLTTKDHCILLFFYSSILKSLSLEGFTSLVGYDQTATSSFPFHHSFLQFCCCPFTSCSAFCLCYYIQSLLFPPLVFVSFSLKEKNTKNGTEVWRGKLCRRRQLLKWSLLFMPGTYRKYSYLASFNLYYLLQFFSTFPRSCRSPYTYTGLTPSSSQCAGYDQTATLFSSTKDVLQP